MSRRYPEGNSPRLAVVAIPFLSRVRRVGPSIGAMGFQRGDEVVATVDLGGFWQGKIPAGTPGVVEGIEETDHSAVVFTVRFTIVQDDLLVPHHVTVTDLVAAQVAHA